MGSLGPGIKKKASSYITDIRPLTREDLAEIMIPRNAPVVQRLRDPHHHVVRLIAAGVRPMEEVARRSGYTIARIHGLNTDPAFKELVASYRGAIDAAFIRSQDDYYELATSNMVKAERQIAEKLERAEEEGELLPTRDLIAISRDAADRFGYGKKAMNVNVNVDFASKLEQAIARSGKVIDPSLPISPGADGQLPLIRRRA